MRRTPPRVVGMALTAVKAAGFGAFLALTIGAGLQVTGDSTEHAEAVADAYERVVERAMDDQRCSTSGFDRDVVPGSALIRTPAGQVQVVSFDRGWAVYNGRRPGTLIAVCLEREPVRPAAGTD
ncbi:hypothetical protein [Nocardioides sp. SYSU D00038]|uniref:hypothetical protein n=1 Tax=Nocardioides sp. SYSU D00038 TaxID=2812554 RepID=UPI001967F95A|nr:hypothetical protein [Nocardioides sp. SYSU D00038]